MRGKNSRPSPLHGSDQRLGPHGLLPLLWGRIVPLPISHRHRHLGEAAGLAQDLLHHAISSPATMCAILNRGLTALLSEAFPRGSPRPTRSAPVPRDGSRMASHPCGCQARAMKAPTWGGAPSRERTASDDTGGGVPRVPSRRAACRRRREPTRPEHLTELLTSQRVRGEGRSFEPRYEPARRRARATRRLVLERVGR